MLSVESEKRESITHKRMHMKLEKFHPTRRTTRKSKTSNDSVVSRYGVTLNQATLTAKIMEKGVAEEW